MVAITLLCGYLGAGKTTLMNEILQNQKGYKVAVIVNDIGEINVDASLIKKGGAITDESSLVPLTNGCICCSLKSDLALQIEELIASGDFDYILIEASGVCEPLPIAGAIEEIEGGVLDNVVSVVDAKRLVDEFASGEKLLKKVGEEDVESLLIQQIEFCSTLIINKIDLVTSEELACVKAVVRRLQPNAKIIETVRSKCDISEMLHTKRFNFEKVFESAGWVASLAKSYDSDNEGAHHSHHEHKKEGENEDEYGFSSFIYFRRRPFNRTKLENYTNNWPSSIIRTKGVVWFSDENDTAYVFESAGRQLQAGPSGAWLASLSEDEQRAVRKAEPIVDKEWDEKVGDRMIKLCVIGRHLQKDVIEKELDSLLE